jgi:hypothetical protein
MQSTLESAISIMDLVRSRNAIFDEERTITTLQGQEDARHVGFYRELEHNSVQ